MGDNFMKKILIILIAAFVFQFFVFGEEDSYEETFEQNETADMKDSFSQDDVLGLDGIFWEKPKSQFRLGSLYYNGDVVERNLEKAKYWFEKLVKQSNTIRTLLYLATLYYDGGDYKKAKYWWEKAAEQGDSDAQNNLGYIYFYGKGVEIDYEEAFYWTIKAATSFYVSVEAQYRLSEMYEKGLGVPRDYDKAKYWREKADAQKKEEAE